MREIFKTIQVAALVGAIALPCFAYGQEAADAEPISYGDEEVEAKYVGISGGAIAGAELVVAVEAIFGVKELWPYLTFPILGAAGGGVGGYFLEDASPKGAIALLVGSMALIIPTAIAASSARAYDPEEEGALSGDVEEGSGFSLELSPKQGGQEGASTDVESRPAGAPTDDVPLPEAGNPPDKKVEEAEPDTETAPSEDSPKTEAAPDGDGQTRNEKVRERDSARRSARLAGVRRASAGALFYMDSDGAAAVSIPIVDVRQGRASSEDGFFKTRQAIEVFVPIFRLDLP